MAAELKVVTTFAFTPTGGPPISQAPGTLSVDISNTKSIQNTQNIGTSAEALQLGDLASLGWFWGKNYGSYTIYIRNDSDGTNVVAIAAGESCAFRLATNTPYALAPSGASDLAYAITGV